MLREIKNGLQHYFADENGTWQGKYTQWHADGNIMVSCFFLNGNYHGEYKRWWKNGQLQEHLFYNNSCRHGEYKMYNTSGSIIRHYFFVNDDIVLFSKLPYPETPEDRMFFKLKYDIPLIPVDQPC